ncbi:TetR/AcrR family transcriptional regulator [Marivirga harenae]|uniref:TetR/AcrR family transcriptional regulator n=1 Tax=Marivirga harenae TaxID=2010992 RepID=UPI0026DED1EB|nr:TetR/AcrR family transcriptional regulator [Marivirga harenae]WKV13743.1 TetR/AcrR family transcriptional regulator [Marivirga harenae]|tara:strand:- start:29451 stop:30005 length:555 start_codon:yes stop_codon:yes gene_type:complete
MNKRELILQTTLGLITENGFHATPMSMISKKAKVAAGTIYHHFENKEVLLEALYTESKQKMGRAMQLATVGGQNYEADFKSIWISLFIFYAENYETFQFLEQYAQSPFIRKETKEEQRKHYQPIIQFLNDGIDKGLLKSIDVEILTEMVHGTVVSAAKIFHQQKKLTKKSIDDLAQFAWQAAKA